MLRAALIALTFVACSIALIACGSDAASRASSLSQGTAPTATPATLLFTSAPTATPPKVAAATTVPTAAPPTLPDPSLLTIDEVLREFDAHALRVDPSPPKPPDTSYNTTPRPTEVRYVFNGDGSYLLIYQFASNADARASSLNTRSMRIGRFTHRNIVLEFIADQSTQMDYHVIVLASLR